MSIPRLHLFEFEDLGWFPGTIRNLMTDFLRQSTIQMRLHLPIVGILEKATAAAGTDRIVDLCSGGGGLLVEIQREMTRRLRRPVTVTFTDKFPNAEALGPICALDPEHLRFVAEPVDATAVPSELRGVRTMFSALHHFRPETAMRILQDAVDNGCGIAVIEVSRRTLGGFLPMLLSPFATLAMTPWIRPFTFKRFAFTYLIPLVPFFVMWDGIVSAFRTYTPEELRSMVGTLRAPGYSWDVGRVRGALGYKITYLVGAPA